MAARTLTVPAPSAPITIVRHKTAYTHLQVPSSDPSKASYDVFLTADFGRCTCLGYVMKGRPCRHINEAREATGQI